MSSFFARGLAFSPFFTFDDQTTLFNNLVAFLMINPQFFRARSGALLTFHFFGTLFLFNRFFQISGSRFARRSHFLFSLGPLIFNQPRIPTFSDQENLKTSTPLYIKHPHPLPLTKITFNSTYTPPPTPLLYNPL